MTFRRSRGGAPCVVPAARSLRDGVAAAAILGVSTTLLASSVGATPITYMTAVGAVKWKVPTVTFYIPLDPKPGGSAHNDVKKAVDEWNKTTPTNGLTLKAVILDAAGNDPATGKPPDPNAKGTVIVEYTTGEGDATPQFEGIDTGRTDTNGNPIVKDGEYTTGRMRVGTNAPGLVYVISLHEVGHMLGLDHDTASDSVMQKSVDLYEKLTTPGATDKKEFGSVYARSDARLDGSAFALASGDYRYDYTAAWLSGGDIPLVEVLVLGAPIRDPQIPIGWGIAAPPAGEPANFFALRVDPTDTLQAYLSADNPSLFFSFVSPSAPTTTFGWAGSDQPVQLVVGPQAVPEPSSVVLMFGGAAVLVTPALARCRARRTRLKARAIQRVSRYASQDAKTIGCSYDRGPDN